MTVYFSDFKNNPKLQKNIAAKAVILSAIREFFHREGFLGVDTPTMVISPDPSPFNEVFEVRSFKGEKYYLTPSPEFFIKKLLSAGLKNVYQITKAYRDMQENDLVHLREFTILEWYRTGGTYLDLMEDCENLINYIYQYITVETGHAWSLQTIEYQGTRINITAPWHKLSCEEAFKKYAKIDLRKFLSFEIAKKICRQHGYQVNEKNSWEELYHQIFLNEVEPNFPKDRPFFLYDYPAPLAALSKIKKDDSDFAERVELYIGGLELANGYSELTDSREQEKRLKANIETRKEKKMRVFDYDQQFVEALKSGFPQTAGIALGIDRLIMLFCNSADIHDITPFAL